MAEGTHSRSIHPLEVAASGARSQQVGRILLIDHDELVRQSVARTLQSAGHHVTALADAAAALPRLEAEPFDLLLAEARLPGANLLELFAGATKLRPELPVIALCAYTSVRTAVEAMRRGACGYIQKPFEKDELLLVVERTLAHARRGRDLETLQAMAGEAGGQRNMTVLGSSGLMRMLREHIEQAAQADGPVLVTGERGSGRELVARMIHARSRRHERPVLTVNCPSLAERGLEPELFGPARSQGSSPGRGRLELADGGTLLLKEVTRAPLAVQGRLARVIEEGAFVRPDSGITQRVDVRIIATTGRPLAQAVEEGRFSTELFSRLARGSLEVPPLRQRREDVPELARHFLHRIARRDGQAFRHVEPEAMRLLQRYGWPGNVAELLNILERANVLETEPGVLRAATIAPWLGEARRPRDTGDPLDQLPLAEVEKRVILDTLAKFEGHRARTATALGIGVRTLGIKLKKWRDEASVGCATVTSNR